MSQQPDVIFLCVLHTWALLYLIFGCGLTPQKATPTVSVCGAAAWKADTRGNAVKIRKARTGPKLVLPIHNRTGSCALNSPSRRRSARPAPHKQKDHQLSPVVLIWTPNAIEVQ